MKILKIMITITAAMIFMAGCATTSIDSTNYIKIKMNSDGTFTLNNQTYSLKQLPKQLKKQGGNSQTQIDIKLPADADKNMLVSYGATLKQNGFGRYGFLGEKKTTYTIKEE